MRFGIDRPTIPHRVEQKATKHWVCFSCKKMFRKPPKVSSAACPQCGSRMIDMGRHFAPPPMSDSRLWNRLAKLAEQGYRLHSAAVRDLIFGALNDSRAPSARTVAARMDVLLERGTWGLVSLLAPDPTRPSKGRRGLTPE